MKLEFQTTDIYLEKVIKGDGLINEFLNLIKPIINLVDD
jgi:hypothetical protein